LRDKLLNLLNWSFILSHEEAEIGKSEDILHSAFIGKQKSLLVVT